ncbi:MAG: MBOAT family protein [Lachnospiraceae bacterium]|nr:MBOAT family protein [Lachnospiraceae bacterium]
MQFNSFDFMFFFPVVLAVYFIIPRRGRKLWLLAASYYFYMSWNAVYALLIGASTLITFFCGILVERFSGGEDAGRKKKLALAACITLNLAILAVFKYGNFAIESLEAVLRLLHVSVSGNRLNLLLPVGISFYTFQALGYSIDVYRGEIKAEKNLIRYALFVSFFPQLVAGPIERSKNLLSQMEGIESLSLWNAKRVTSGAILMVWGFFLKMVIADRIALLVNRVFDHYPMYGRTELIIAVVAFTIQIYCDFNSYSTIATGAARILGFELMENFNTPFFAKGIRDHWNRWHISLSTWFRDYLYIPLGGNRRGKKRKMLNLMIVFLVSGLWHGASWHYVIWGGIHGFFQVTGELLQPFRRRLVEKLHIRTDVFSFELLQILVTDAMIVFSFVFFRSDTVTDALHYLKRIILRPTPWAWFDGSLYGLGLDRTEVNILLFSLLLLLLADLIRYRKKITIDVWLMRQNLWFEWAVVIVLIWMIFVFGKYGQGFDPQQFIYFQF